MPPFQSGPYDRRASVDYAHRWAYGRNPNYFSYDGIGGDCTNFASQCLYAGSGVMNYTPTFGWYYIDANRKAPAWTGVPYFYNFVTRDEISEGPYGVNVPIELILPGDFVQLKFNEWEYGHTPVIVSTGETPTLQNTLVAAHSEDADWRPISTYQFRDIRFIHILGVWKSED